MSQEDTDLSTHVSLCHLRYQQLEARLNVMEDRLIKVETTLSTLKSEMVQGFTEIKLLLEQKHNQRQAQIIATVGSVLVAVLGVIGYLLVKHN
mgnify:CR=1 FL=1